MSATRIDRNESVLGYQPSDRLQSTPPAQAV